MKRYIKFFSIILAFFTISFLITSYIRFNNEPKYVISDYNDKLAVYKYQEEMPQNIYDIYVSSFPSEERKNIKNGIKIYSENELQKILEAYLS